MSSSSCRLFLLCQANSFFCVKQMKNGTFDFDVTRFGDRISRGNEKESKVSHAYLSGRRPST
jgi:hypothetical protein